MQSGPAQARLRIKETLDAHPELTLILDASGGPASRLKARFLEHGENSIKVQLSTALGEQILVSIAGEVETGAGQEPVYGKYRVRSCRVAGIGKYQAELTAEDPTVDDATASHPGGNAAGVNGGVEADYYEILQVSRNADTDSIRRVFHGLAQRYHPDNKETGNAEKFRQVVDAHAVLSDPEKRAAHDVRLASEDKMRYRLFDSLQSTEGVQAEIRKRQGILRLLYSKRLTDPENSAMRGRDFAEMLGCPIEHLQFAMWYLREQRCILRSDNNRFEITIQGVEAFEAEQSNYSKKQLIALPAPA
jgi:hypothetical protein